ncbi:MAG: pseudouridine synthase [Candidatus Acidiferrales bacterium]
MKPKPVMTLDRVLSRFGIASRTDSRTAILEGRVKVNGRVVRDPDLWVRPGQDAFHLDGQRLKPARPIAVLFYKPKGVITSHGDPQGRPTIYQYLGDSGRWMFPVGRLDLDSSGLLLLTNDTKLADYITNPRSGVPKTYRVKTNALLPDEVIGRLGAGVEMKRGDWARPLSVRRIEDRGKYTWLEVILTEGKNREVRRMIEAMGFKVLKLVRTGIGGLTLEGLKVGAWRRLSPQEVSALRTSRRAPKEREPASAIARS